MLKIGEFSKLSRVSVRMLRHYDEIGLLKPAETDRFTDYRYYREDQLPTAGRIAALKDMGFSLADIVRILEVYDDREKMEQFFSARQKELEALSQDTAYKLTLLDAARKRLRKEEDMSYNVTLKTIPQRYLREDQPTPPILIMHGSRDMTVNFQQSVHLYEALRSMGKVCEFIRLEGADHGWRGFACDAALDAVDEFLKKHL